MLNVSEWPSLFKMSAVKPMTWLRHKLGHEKTGLCNLHLSYLLVSNLSQEHGGLKNYCVNSLSASRMRCVCFLSRQFSFVSHFRTLTRSFVVQAGDWLRDKLTINTIEYGRTLGYDIESHAVTTRDGYVLTLHRIKGSKAGRLDEWRRPVVLQHGLWSSSLDWIINGPENSLALTLAESGFDVWLGNSRGNQYSRAHVRLDPLADSKDYWDFSWHEMGVEDLPAVIDYVLNISKHRDLYYVGHSQGTTSFFVFSSTFPEYNAKIRCMIGLAPVAFLYHIPNSPLKVLARLAPPLFFASRLSGTYNTYPGERGLQAASNLMNFSLAEKAMAVVISNLTTYAPQEIHDQISQIILSHMESGASLKQLAHFAQICVKDQNFRQFDYGNTANEVKYGSADPPAYNLSNITCPIVLFYSDGDWMVHPTDVENLYSFISNKQGLHKLGLPKFNHLDFLWARKTTSPHFDEILRILNDDSSQGQAEGESST